MLHNVRPTLHSFPYSHRLATRSIHLVTVWRLISNTNLSRTTGAHILRGPLLMWAHLTSETSRGANVSGERTRLTTSNIQDGNTILSDPTYSQRYMSACITYKYVLSCV